MHCLKHEVENDPSIQNPAKIIITNLDVGTSYINKIRFNFQIIIAELMIFAFTMSKMEILQELW